MTSSILGSFRSSVMGSQRGGRSVYSDYTSATSNMDEMSGKIIELDEDLDDTDSTVSMFKTLQKMVSTHLSVNLIVYLNMYL